MLATFKKFFVHQDLDERSNRWIFSVILLFSAISLLVAFILSIEKIHLIENPNATLSCSINAVLNCASVMKTEQASVLGFPNSFIGLMAEPVFITLAVGWLSGARYRRWFMLGALGGSLVAFLFAQWLFFQSVYGIGVLCPWCLLVTASSTIVFAAFLRYSLRDNLLGIPKKQHQFIKAWLKKDYDKFLFAAWLVLLTLLAFLQFPDMFA